MAKRQQVRATAEEDGPAAFALKGFVCRWRRVSVFESTGACADLSDGPPTYSVLTDGWR